MKLQFASSGLHDSTAVPRRRFNPQPSIPRFFVAGDMIRPLPLEGVVPHRRAGERPAGPLFEARVANPTGSPAKVAAKPVSATAPKANPFAAPTDGAKRPGLFSRLASHVAALFKRRAVPGGGVGAVQPELRLDTVKPLRNELTDSDSEPAETPAPALIAVTVPGNGAAAAPSPRLVAEPAREGSPNLDPLVKT